MYEELQMGLYGRRGARGAKSLSIPGTRRLKADAGAVATSIGSKKRTIGHFYLRALMLARRQMEVQGRLRCKGKVVAAAAAAGGE